MRFDLVVNAFVLNALQSGRLVLHNGGEMWRPLLSIQDAAAAYQLMLEAPAEKIGGEIFNATNGNYRISELALRVQHKLAGVGVRCEIEPDYNYRDLRSCQASRAARAPAPAARAAETSAAAPAQEIVRRSRVGTGTFAATGEPPSSFVEWARSPSASR